MKDSSIGIKVADGTLFPVLEEGFQGKKRLVVTTVRDDQTVVQIDLYRGPGEATGDAGGVAAETAEYIGSLIIDNIPPMGKGDPEIEVVLGVDDTGNLEATASDKATGEMQSLSVGLESLDSDSTYEIPEFAIENTTVVEEEGEEPAQELEEDLLTGDTYPIGEKDRRLEHLDHRRRRSPWWVVLFILAALLLIAALTYLIFRGMGGSATPPLFGRGTAAETTAAAAPAAGTPAAEAPAAPAAQPAASTEPAAAAQPVAASLPAAPPATGPAPPANTAGVWYKIVWGDTLWDISATYYRNPWLYPRIARANRIKNPDLIIAGTKIFIPEN